MNRYIDADWIIQKLERWRGQLAETYGENDEYVLCLGEVLMKLDDAPTADVRENVRGEWLDYWDNPIKYYFDGRYSAHCSVCGYHPEYEEEMRSANFCPNCGADMRMES